MVYGLLDAVPLLAIMEDTINGTQRSLLIALVFNIARRTSPSTFTRVLPSSSPLRECVLTICSFARNSDRRERTHYILVYTEVGLDAKFRMPLASNSIDVTYFPTTYN